MSHQRGQIAFQYNIVKYRNQIIRINTLIKLRTIILIKSKTNNNILKMLNLIIIIIKRITYQLIL